MKVGIIACENIAKSARVLCEVLHYNYNIFVIDSWNDVREKVQMLKDDDYSLIVGDTVSVAYAEQMGTQSMLLISGAESISQAFDNVVTVYNYYSRLKMQDANAAQQANLHLRDLLFSRGRKAECLSVRRSKSPHRLCGYPSAAAPGMHRGYPQSVHPLTGKTEPTERRL